jgi:hypothetical protein
MAMTIELRFSPWWLMAIHAAEAAEHWDFVGWLAANPSLEIMPEGDMPLPEILHGA